MAEERCAPIFFAPFVSSPMRVEAAWVDDHGRLPVAYHHLLFERAVEEAFFVVGLGCAHEDGTGPLPAESHTRHRRDLKAGDEVRITLQLVDHDLDRLHLYLEMRHAAEGWTAAACELVAVHADVATRKAEPFPTEVLQNLAVMKATHARLGRPASSCGVALPRRKADRPEPVMAARTRH